MIACGQVCARMSWGIDMMRLTLTPELSMFGKDSTEVLDACFSFRLIPAPPWLRARARG
jgi:hypothetical protein